jgi:hypothetical protein
VNPTASTADLFGCRLPKRVGGRQRGTVVRIGRQLNVSASRIRLRVGPPGVEGARLPTPTQLARPAAELAS